MRKFLKNLFLFALCIGILSFGICYFIDPFNVFHPLNMRHNGAEPNKNYVKMSYILTNPEKFESYIFGSSHVGNIHPEKISNERCYNMTYSIGLPHEHLENLKTFIANGVHPKKIYIGLDSYSYTVDPADHFSDRQRSPYEYSKSHPFSFWKLYLDPAVAFDSLSLTKSIYDPENYEEVFYSFGWNQDYGTRTYFTEEKAEAEMGSSFRLEETLEDVREIVEFCETNEIKTVVFTNPMFRETYLESVKNKSYFDFLKGLTEITPFYNFSSLNTISTDIGCFLDNSHYLPEVGDLMIKSMCYQEDLGKLNAQGFGVLFNQDNIDFWLNILEGQIQ